MSQDIVKSLHITGPVAFESGTNRIATQVPLPIVLYLTEEIMLDDEYSDEMLAGMLHRNVVYAVGHFRKALKAEQEQPGASAHEAKPD